MSKSTHTKVMRLAGVLALVFAATGCASLDQSVKSDSKSPQEIAVEAQIDAALKRVADQPRWSSSMDDRAQFASLATNSISVSYQGSAADFLTAILQHRARPSR